VKLKTSQVAPIVTHEALDEGDTIAVTVTHQINIQGDNSWVKYEATSKVRPGETTDEADERLLTHVSTTSVKLAARAAQQVLELGQ